jgi:hypothetical protein
MVRSSAISMLALGLISGCGGAHPALVTVDETLAPAHPEESGDVVVEVISYNFRDANIYMYLGASRQRLGLASGNATSVFTVPWNARMANAIEATLTAEQIGDESTVQSSSVRLNAGSRLVWTLSSQFYEVRMDVY